MMVRLIICILLGIFLAVGCEEQKPAKNLSYAKRKKVDSTFKAHQPEIDSFLEIACIRLEADSLQIWVDSLYQKRMNEINELRNQ